MSSARLLAAILIAFAATPLAAAPTERADGTTTLPVPRFVSLKAGKAMLRSGPDDRRFPILWEYRRRGLPLEVLREYGIWRQVRDPEGTIGWMNKSLLTGIRTGVITDPGDATPRLLYTAPDMQARIAWRIEPGTVVTITLCEDIWCRVAVGGRSGFILRSHLWGTYPKEAITS
ncbi:SH3 domain-containing protein [Polymorphobacter sp.]|uniref:SH3 domain-containing protein n=1 Tax=Polymorphobacter sp. TaxID=1909290 RepID=UPI003F726DF6